MIPYLAIFSLAFFMYWQRKNNNLRMYYFFMFACAFMVGSRDMIGGYDIYIYAEIFESAISTIQTVTIFEKGYILFNVFIRFFTEDRYVFFFLCALLTYFLHGSVIKKVSPLILFSAFIYFSKFFLMSFVYVRQFLAMGIIWLAIPFLLKNQRIIPILLCFLAFAFHQSSIVFFPFIFLCFVRLGKYQLIMLIIITMGIFMTPLGSALLSSFAESSGNNKLAEYSQLSSGVNFFYILEIVLLIFLLVKFSGDFFKKDDTNLVFNGIVLYTLLTTIGITNATYIRFGWYYYIFVIIGLPYIYIYIKSYKIKHFYKLLIFIYFGLMSIRLLFTWDGGDMIPYKAFYLDTERKGRFEFLEYRNRNK